MKILRMIGAFLFAFATIVGIALATIVLVGLLLGGGTNNRTSSPSYDGWGQAIVLLFVMGAGAVTVLTLVILQIVKACTRPHKDKVTDWLGYPASLILLVAFWLSPYWPFHTTNMDSPVYGPVGQSYRPPILPPKAQTKIVTTEPNVDQLLGNLMMPGSTISSMSRKSDLQSTVPWPSITMVPPASMTAHDVLNWCEIRATGGVRKEESYRVETVRPGDGLPTVLYAFRAKAGPEAGQMVVMFMTHAPAR